MDLNRDLGGARVLRVDVFLQEMDRQQSAENQEHAPAGRLQFHSCCYIDDELLYGKAAVLVCIWRSKTRS
jgi:hypothetical protein